MSSMPLIFQGEEGQARILQGIKRALPSHQQCSIGYDQYSFIADFRQPLRSWHVQYITSTMANLLAELRRQMVSIKLHLASTSDGE